MSQENIHPNVYVDILLEKDLLFFLIKNNSEFAATDVVVRFNRNVYKEVNVLGKKRKERINKLTIFNQLLYLAPQKEIKIFIDQLDSFFKFNKTPVYRLSVYYKDESGKQKFKKIINHDVNVYRDLPILF